MSTANDDQAQICWSCKERAATVAYFVGQKSTMVCPRCQQWLTSRSELEQLLRDNLELEDEGRIDEALQRLDAFVKAHAGIDRDLQFQRQIAHHRAMMLIDAERYVEAESACTAWAQLGFANAWERWEHGFEAARMLRALGRLQEALSTLENAMTHEDGMFLAASEKLELLVDLADELGQPVNPKWQRLAQSVANAYGVELEPHAVLSQTIRRLAEAIRDKLPTSV